MSTTKHVPVETGDDDQVGMVKLCDCCRRPWVYRKIVSPFGPLQRLLGGTALAWTPETFRERWARRWWQFTLRFKGKSAAKKGDRRARKVAEGMLRQRRAWDGVHPVPMFIETTTTETVITEGATSSLDPASTYTTDAPGAAVSEEMKKKVWEE